MDDKTVDYEKLGAFYLGKEYDLAESKLSDNLVLYDSKDLVTHGVIIGMTGSGKTGLGIALLEEALVDNIPFIAIDPKGDLTNLLLTFDKLSPENFRPWINEAEAITQNLSPDDFAKGQAELWEKGLGEWGQSAQRIQKLRNSVDFSIYTPGASSGLQVSVLRSFDVPSNAVLEDSDALREKIGTTATSLLALLNIDADPVTSREHILISNILSHNWNEGKNLDIAALIHAIQEPPFTQIGVMDIESFYSQKDRHALSMKLNNLLASPGFAAWTQGEPLDIGRMFYTSEGKPRACIFTISHLSDSERMFFVSMLLNEVLGWMRGQSGTTSLRALLYMDEIFGYLPPTANPPSKTPMLTLLKQARAFGLGLVLSTQNSVDLDYKALSNAGTWFIGRLQTERDKARVLEGLEGASSSGFDKAAMDKTLSGLGKRVFLMHNVNDNTPTVFQTRWAMSYLRGPMTREQIKTLMQGRKAVHNNSSTNASATPSTANDVGAHGRVPLQQQQSTPSTTNNAQPITPQGVNVYYVPATSPNVSYSPAVLGMLEAHYSSAKYSVNESVMYALAAELQDGPIVCDWENAGALSINVNQLQTSGATGAAFSHLPKDAMNAKNFDKWQKDLLTHIRQKKPLTLYQSKDYKLTSKPGESAGDFRGRLALSSREGKDAGVQKLRDKYSEKIATLQRKLTNAQTRVQREQGQVRQQQLETVVSVGSALLGAFMGKKKISASNVSRASSAVKSVGRVSRQQSDVSKASESVESIQGQITALEAQLQAELDKVSGGGDATTINLETVQVLAKSTDLSMKVFGLVWLPFRKNDQGTLTPDWS
ncbi:MAG: ATP-binding protein [Trueperaceae bacterium]